MPELQETEIPARIDLFAQQLLVWIKGNQLLGVEAQGALENLGETVAIAQAMTAQGSWPDNRFIIFDEPPSTQVEVVQ